MSVNLISCNQTVNYPSYNVKKGPALKRGQTFDRTENADTFEKSSHKKEPKKLIFKRCKSVDDKSVLLKHEKFARLAQDTVYDYNTLSKYDNFKRVCTVQNEDTGFSSSIYMNPCENQIVISYRCTNNKAGVKSDIQMVTREIPDQFYDAEDVYNVVKNEYPDADIVLVGYSLGGSLAQLVASAHKDAKAITFSAFGTSEILKNKHLNDNKNCINYASSKDIVSNAAPHPGKTRTVKTGPVDIKEAHSLEHYKDLKNAKCTNEKAAAAKRRIFAAEITNPAGEIAKQNPQLSEVIPGYFFSA